MRLASLMLFALVLLGCAETVRCPEGQVFGSGGACVPIPDGGGPVDARSADAQ